MRHILAAAVAAGLSAGAAQAAVYQYDMTMKMTEFSLYEITSDGQEAIPNWAQKDDCSFDTNSGYSCRAYNLNILENRPTESYLTQYEPVVTASLTLDTEFGSGGMAPICEGPSVLCWGIYDGTNYSVTADGFTIQFASSFFDRHFSSDGYNYADDGYYSGNLGGAGFVASNGVKVSYTTTGIEIAEIAPVPLPASFPLLALGVAGFGWAARRRKS